MPTLESIQHAAKRIEDVILYPVKRLEEMAMIALCLFLFVATPIALLILAYDVLAFITGR